jgi:phosphoglycolate phosphatase
MTLKPRLIVFDCDGTLVDSQQVIAEAMRLAFLCADLIPPDRAAILRTVGLSIPEALAELAPEQSLEVREEIGRCYREQCMVLRQRPHMQEPMFRGAAAFISDLAARDDVILGIATGKSRRGVQRFIEYNGLEGVFTTIQTADDAPSKPHPAMLQQAMRETGISPDATIMIGDTSFDMIMAVRANATAIGVTWGYHSAFSLKKAGAHSVVQSFPELAHTLEPQHAVISPVAA